MEYGKYDETARYFRRMEELAEQLAAADPDALEPLKVKASVKATLGDFQMDRIGDAEAALKFFDQALALRRQWLAREPSNDEAKRGVANMLGAIARARLLLGDPAKARDMYREEVALRDQFSPALADQVEVRRERAGLSDKLGDLSVSLGDPKAAREHFQQALELRKEIAAQNPDETQAQRDVLLSLEKLGTHELIYSRDPKIARQYYQEALDGFLERLEGRAGIGAGQDGRRPRALLRRHGRPSRGGPRLRDGPLPRVPRHPRRAGQGPEGQAQLAGPDARPGQDRRPRQGLGDRRGNDQGASPRRPHLLPLRLRIRPLGRCRCLVASLRGVDPTGPPLHRPRLGRPSPRPESAAGRAPRRSRPTPTSTRSAPIPSSWPCSMSSGRRGRDG